MRGTSRNLSLFMDETALPTSRRDFLASSLVVAGALSLGEVRADNPAAASSEPEAAPLPSYDLVIYGGTPAAITAAVLAKRKGKSVVIVCQETHLGGLTASGLGWTDSKNGAAVGGLAREFYHRIWKAYNDPAAWTLQTRQSYLDQKVGAQPGPAIDEARQVMWAFEPKVAERVMEEWLRTEKVPVFRGERIVRDKGGVIKNGATITAFKTLSGKTFRGRMFMDAGYEGDLMAGAGVSYRVGRDSAAEFDEPLNGVRFRVPGDRGYADDEFPGVDPWVVPGKPESGLIAGIEGVWAGSEKAGDADHKRLQSFNYRLCLTTDPRNRVAIAKPAGYDEREYELLFRLLAAAPDEKAGFTTEAMPNLKIDANNHGKMSGDYVGGNFSVRNGWDYSDGSYEQRDKMVWAHRTYQQGLLWTLQNHARIPEAHRKRLAAWGLSKDEFADNDNWPYQLYIREARRMEGVAIVTQHHVQQKTGFPVKDSIGLGSYSLDSHEVRRVVMDGKIRGEGGFYVWETTPYPLPLGCILPRKTDATNLLVPVTLSATHAAFGSIRMEPTYMILGQAAATIACLALDKQAAPVQDIPYAEIATQLRADGQRLIRSGTSGAVCG